MKLFAAMPITWKRRNFSAGLNACSTRRKRARRRLCAPKRSHVGEVFYPKVRFRKGQMIDYYVRISKWLLPHLKDRPLTLKRYPNGVEAEFFYEKRCPTFRPKWFKTASIWSEGNQENINF